MKRSLALRLTLLTALLAVACANAPADAPPSVLGVDRTRTAAVVAADTEALDPLLHADLVYTHSNGTVDTKDSLMKAIAAGDVDYQRIETHGEVIRAQRGVGIVQTPVEMEVAAGGQLHRITGGYTATYVWQDDRWQLIAYQSTSSDVRSEPLPTRL